MRSPPPHHLAWRRRKSSRRTCFRSKIFFLCRVGVTNRVFGADETPNTNMLGVYRLKCVAERTDDTNNARRRKNQCTWWLETSQLQYIIRMVHIQAARLPRLSAGIDAPTPNTHHQHLAYTEIITFFVESFISILFLRRKVEHNFYGFFSLCVAFRLSHSRCILHTNVLQRFQYGCDMCAIATYTHAHTDLFVFPCSIMD